MSHSSSTGWTADADGAPRVYDAESNWVADCRDSATAIQIAALRERCERLEAVVREMLPDIAWNTVARWHPEKTDGKRLLAALSGRAPGEPS